MMLLGLGFSSKNLKIYLINFFLFLIKQIPLKKTFLYGVFFRVAIVTEGFSHGGVISEFRGAFLTGVLFPDGFSHRGLIS